MNIGKPKRSYTVEPLEDPVPRRDPRERPEQEPQPEPARPEEASGR